MKLSVVTPDLLDAAHIDRWRSIQGGNSDLVSPYFCPEFTRLVGSVRNDSYVGVIKEGNDIKGFFPFQRISKYIAGPIGGPLSDYHGLIIEKGYEIDAKELLIQSGLKSWKFNHLIASQPGLRRYHQIKDVSYVIDLSKGPDHYLDNQRSSGSKLVKSTSRMLRKLEREIGPLSYLYHSTDECDLQRLFEWKSQQYRSTGMMDVFSFEWVRNLLYEIRSMQSDNFSGVLSALYAEDTLIAVHLGMYSNQVLHWWFPAYNVEYAKYSPGSILLMKVIQDSPNRKINSIDLGKGSSQYKDRFHNLQIDLAEGIISLHKYPEVIKNVGEFIANIIRRTPLVVPARIPARIIRKYRNWKKFS